MASRVGDLENISSLSHSDLLNVDTIHPSILKNDIC